MLRRLATWLSLVAILVSLVLPPGCLTEPPAQATDTHAVTAQDDLHQIPHHQDLDDSTPTGSDDLCTWPTCPAHGMLRPAPATPRPPTLLARAAHIEDPESVYVSDVIGGVFHPPRSRQIHA